MPISGTLNRSVFIPSKNVPGHLVENYDSLYFVIIVSTVISRSNWSSAERNRAIKRELNTENRGTVL